MISKKKIAVILTSLTVVAGAVVPTLSAYASQSSLPVVELPNDGPTVAIVRNEEGNYSQVVLASDEITDVSIQFDEVAATVEQMNDGITIVMTKNEDGTFEQEVYYDISQVPQPIAVSDGVLEWAIFHLGFKNWSGDTGDLYFTVSADEPLNKVSGDAYVKESTIWSPSTYYSGSFISNLFGALEETKTIKSGVNTGSVKSVKVGFEDVELVTSAGETAAFRDNSLTVTR